MTKKRNNKSSGQSGWDNTKLLPDGYDPKAKPPKRDLKSDDAYKIPRIRKIHRLMQSKPLDSIKQRTTAIQKYLTKIGQQIAERFAQAETSDMYKHYRLNANQRSHIWLTTALESLDKILMFLSGAFTLSVMGSSLMVGFAISAITSGTILIVAAAFTIVAMLVALALIHKHLNGQHNDLAKAAELEPKIKDLKNNCDVQRNIYNKLFDAIVGAGVRLDENIGRDEEPAPVPVTGFLGKLYASISPHLRSFILGAMSSATGVWIFGVVFELPTGGALFIPVTLFILGSGAALAIRKHFYPKSANEILKDAEAEIEGLKNKIARFINGINGLRAKDNTDTLAGEPELEAKYNKSHTYLNGISFFTSRRCSISTKADEEYIKVDADLDSSTSSPSPFGSE